MKRPVCDMFRFTQPSAGHFLQQTKGTFSEYTHCGIPYCLQIILTLTFLKPTGHVMHQQFNIQQLYALPTLYLCVLYLAENKQRLVPLTALTDWFL